VAENDTVPDPAPNVAGAVKVTVDDEITRSDAGTSVDRVSQSAGRAALAGVVADSPVEAPVTANVRVELLVQIRAVFVPLRRTTMPAVRSYDPPAHTSPKSITVRGPFVGKA
jgi:hypothetical protein